MIEAKIPPPTLNGPSSDVFLAIRDADLIKIGLTQAQSKTVKATIMAQVISRTKMGKEDG